MSEQETINNLRTMLQRLVTDYRIEARHPIEGLADEADALLESLEAMDVPPSVERPNLGESQGNSEERAFRQALQSEPEVWYPCGCKASAGAPKYCPEHGQRPEPKARNLGELREQLESIGNKWAVPGTAFYCIVAKMVEVLDRERTYVWEQAHAHYLPIIEQREREARLEGARDEHQSMPHAPIDSCSRCDEIEIELAKLEIAAQGGLMGNNTEQFDFAYNWLSINIDHRFWDIPLADKLAQDIKKREDAKQYVSDSEFRLLDKVIKLEQELAEARRAEQQTVIALEAILKLKSQPKVQAGEGSET